MVDGLQNLTSNIQTALQQLFIDYDNKAPKHLLTDFDTKIIGGAPLALLCSCGCQVAAAKIDRQHQNGLVNRTWRNFISMVRAWLTQNLLPP